MGMLAWVIMGLALWHYTIFLPDRFWGGIVGAFLASIAGAIVSGLVINAAAHGLAIPGRHATHVVDRPLRDPRRAARDGADLPHRRRARARRATSAL